MLKSLTSQLLSVLPPHDARRNLTTLLRFFLVLALMITAYSVLFHVLMLREGQEHSWLTGLYWTLTVMSTLGFGDITFHTDLGRAFSILVLLSGMIFLLVLLPFTFIRFFYEPWMASQAAARAPRALDAALREHVLLTSYDAVSAALIRRLEHTHQAYALLVPELDEALRLHDLGLRVMWGARDDPDTWRRARADRAALVATTAGDVQNTHVAFTVREVAPEVPIVATAKDPDSVDVLELAGANHVIRLEEMIGQSFARRAIGGDALAHVIGGFDELLIAEATTHRTPLVGRTLRESNLREKAGITVVGVWERGAFEPARPETRIHEHTVLVLAGTRDQLFRYDELFCIYNVANAPVVILGGGRVGRATARALAAREIEYRVVELLPERARGDPNYVIGNAADLSVLERAGIREAPTVIITPHDDDLNVYLTIYCRRLRPNVQIISRATAERNVSTLHRAGADIVMSYASMGAGAIVNVLKKSGLLMVAEGLDIFRVRVPASLDGKTVAESGIRDSTGCSVVGLRSERGMEIVPGPELELRAGGDLLLIGTFEAEQRFLERYGAELGNTRG